MQSSCSPQGAVDSREVVAGGRIVPAAAASRCPFRVLRLQRDTTLDWPASPLGPAPTNTGCCLSPVQADEGGHPSLFAASLKRVGRDQRLQGGIQSALRRHVHSSERAGVVQGRRQDRMHACYVLVNGSNGVVLLTLARFSVTVPFPAPSSA